MKIIEVIIILTNILGNTFLNNIQINNDEIKEKITEAREIYRIGSNDENEDFFNPQSFAVDSKQRVFVLDTKNSRVQCFSKDGNFLFSFGKNGQGPGELSKEARVIKLSSDDKIYIIDYAQKRLNIFDDNGKFIKSLLITKYYNDVEAIDDKIYLVSCYMRKGNIPIDVISKTDGNIEKSIGVLIEPEKGILNKIQKYKNSNLDYFFNMSPYLTVINSKEIIHSLYLPYQLNIIDINTNMITIINGKLDYGNELLFPLTIYDDMPMIIPKYPYARIYRPIKVNNGDIYIPLYPTSNHEYIFVDRYNNKMELIDRMKINTLIKKSEKDTIRQVIIDEEQNMYCLINTDTSEIPYQIIKYKLNLK